MTLSLPLSTANSPFIDLGDIAEVRPGHCTDTFNLCVKQAGKADARAKVAEGGGGRGESEVALPEGVKMPRELCFSLIFREGERAPLDLVAEDAGIRDMWVDALSHLVVTIKSLGQQQEYEM